MSNNEVIYKNDIFSSIEMSHIHPKGDIDKMEEILEDDLFQNNIVKGNIDAKKKVRFPEECKIVSDYFEARNYWHEQKFCSCEELINSYKKACEIYNIKPIPILLEQIKGIDVGLCNERYDMLNLSNVKLELKQIESMEEIFKRVQFKTLNFENTALDDESACSLFEIIEYYESCLKLNLSHNGKISYTGFNACSRMLKKTPCLDTIELKGIIFTDTTIPPLNRALRCGSTLKVLHLENSNICSKNLLILSSALKLNIHLKELHLSCNRMVPSDGIQLGSLLKVNRLLETLDVRNNSLGDVGLSHICDGLSDQFQTQNNRSDNENQGQGLLCLILWSNSITYNGMPSLSDALKATKSLQSLNIGSNPISSEGVHILREGLLANRTLLRLSLPCCRISCEGGVAIAEYLADTKQLTRLDIRDNDIRTAGLMAISLSMKVNKSLTRLDVDPNPKKDPNVKGFVETQNESLKIIQQRVQDNKRLTMEKQDMELSQSFICLSNQHQNTAEVILDQNPSSTDLVQSHDSQPFAAPNYANVSQTVNGLDPVNDADIDLTKASLSLDLSPDAESSLGFIGNFANKILSPTDTLLDMDIQPQVQLDSIIESTKIVDNDAIASNNTEILCETYVSSIDDINIKNDEKYDLVPEKVSLSSDKEGNEDIPLLIKPDVSSNVVITIDNNSEDGRLPERITPSDDDEGNQNEPFQEIDKSLTNSDNNAHVIFPENDTTKDYVDNCQISEIDTFSKDGSNDNQVFTDTDASITDKSPNMDMVANKAFQDNYTDSNNINNTMNSTLELLDNSMIAVLLDSASTLSRAPLTEDLTLTDGLCTDIAPDL